jgi:pilus assembly protein CpaE
VRAADLMDSLARLFSGTQTLPKGKVVVSLSTAGGAGASTMAAFLAASLHERLGETILLDLDLTMGTLGLMMGADVRDSVAGAIANPGLDSALVERILVGDKGPQVLSTAGSLKDSAILNADAVERLVDVARTMSRALVVDLPKGWSETHERLLAGADEVVLVATADLPALRNTRMVLDHLVALRGDGPSPRLIINKSGIAKTREYRGDELREALGLAPSAVIPWDPEPLLARIVAGKPVIDARGKAANALRSFAATVLSAPGRKTAKPARAAFLPSLKTLFVKPA